MSYGTEILEVGCPDDFGDCYVPWLGQVCVDDFGDSVHRGFAWPAWLPARDYFFRGEA